LDAKIFNPTPAQQRQTAPQRAAVNPMVLLPGPLASRKTAEVARRVARVRNGDVANRREQADVMFSNQHRTPNANESKN
jgi:hypothetical protein